ncbi:YceI family protein [Mucilaginibacter sp. BT774]|uniref:YceI family protein n=1 Tax=Mucilaginibacter sp. BT774 TaxID=3062276 RepID=UPI002674636E|nr:YceI family protein [Mucilaginibacter sp. BT774]MDO3627922.1 YceI family protein [Mucilaginibacter sp. BT774]
MKKLILGLLILVASGFSMGTKSSDLGGFSVLTIDPANSNIVWKAEKPTGTHLGTIAIAGGRLNFTCRQLSGGSVNIDMKSINVTDLSAPDKQKLENNLRGDNFFDTEKYPQARLDIVSVDHKSEPSYHFVTVNGNLTMHGVTKRVVFTADITKNVVDQFNAQADIDIDRRDWNVATSNIKYNTLIYKTVHLHVTLQANKPTERISAL